MRVRVNPIRCKAKRTCNEICPEVFKLDVWGYAFIEEGKETVAPELENKVERAAKACPEGAIAIERE